MALIQPQPDVTQPSSRPVIGALTTARYSYLRGVSAGFGFCSARGLAALAKHIGQFAETGTGRRAALCSCKVLVRKKASSQYHAATLWVLGGAVHL